MLRTVIQPLTVTILSCFLIFATSIVSIHSLNAQEENLAGQDVSHGELYIDKLRGCLTVEFTPDSVVQYDGWSPVPLDTISSPYGTGVVMGNNDQDAIFLPAESVDGLGDFTISFYGKLNGLNYFNNILSFANSVYSNEFVIAYNDFKEWKGMMITIDDQLHRFTGAEGILNDLNWHHILLTRSGSRATLIIDGLVRGNTMEVSKGLLKVDPGGFVIGQDQDTIGGGFEAYQCFNGAIANLTIYHYALDIASVYPMAYDFCPEKGTPCDDGNLRTVNDEQDGQCNCIGTPEAKEKELALTRAISERRAMKNRLLLFGMVGLIFFGLSVIYIILLRRRLETARLEKANLEEKQKREQTEKELEQKQKELTTKILQLASKNEFLADLEGEVRQLHATVEGKAKNLSKRISRMIALDTADEEMWDQFSREFNILYSDFMQKLVKDFGSFSTSEVRLISLMKMNMSSKEITNILRISDTGLKKARYRLRKKMNLDSDINLQSFFLTY